MTKNPFPYDRATSQRQGGGQIPPTDGEKHNQKKAQRITEDRRYDGAETTDLRNSPGRVSDDVRN